jgi:Icc-related predicted phosphoesterase
MKILTFSDWRVQPISMMNKIIQKEHPDVVLYAGDDLQRVVPLSKELYIKTDNLFLEFSQKSIEDTAKYVVNQTNIDLFSRKIERIGLPSKNIETQDIPFFYVNGNDDYLIERDQNYYVRVSNSKTGGNLIVESQDGKITTEEKRTLSIAEDISNKSAIYRRLIIKPCFGQALLHNEIFLYGSKCASGFSSELFNLPDKYVDILLVHFPPLGSLDLSVRFGLKHIGSSELRKYVEDFQPKYVVCGHSHFWGGKLTRIGKSTIINISSHDNIGSDGNYAIINWKDDTIEINKEQFKTIRHIRGAFNLYNDQENIAIYGSCNETVNSIVTNNEKLNNYRGFDQERQHTKIVTERHNLLSSLNEEIINSLKNQGKERVANRIESLKWERPKIIKKLNFNPSDYALVDIETGLVKRTNSGAIRHKLWLIGINYQGEIYQFEVPRQKRSFLKFIERHDIKELVSWTSFDSKVLRKVKGLEKIKWIDACRRAALCISWHSYKLH